MSEIERRCGTCKLWRAVDGAAPFGECAVPVADCFDDEDKAWMHESIGGTKCPCWEAKE